MPHVQNLSYWNRYFVIYPHKCTLNNLKKKYQEKWENAYLTVKKGRASRALRRALDPGQYWLASLTRLRFATSAKCRKTFLGPPPWPNPGSASESHSFQLLFGCYMRGKWTEKKSTTSGLYNSTASVQLKWEIIVCWTDKNEKPYCPSQCARGQYNEQFPQRILDFPQGSPTKYLTNFSQNLYENQEILVGGGGTRPSRPLDPLMQGSRYISTIKYIGHWSPCGRVEMLSPPTLSWWIEI